MSAEIQEGGSSEKRGQSRGELAKKGGGRQRGQRLAQNRASTPSEQRGNQADVVGINDKRPQPTNSKHDGRLTLAHGDRVRAAGDGHSTKCDVNCVSPLQSRLVGTTVCAVAFIFQLLFNCPLLATWILDDYLDFPYSCTWLC